VKTSIETREEIVNHAVRWANNMLTEALPSHGGVIHPVARAHLRKAVACLGDVDSSIRFPEEKE
jgi:hypothetical protein